jgi:hypothetical protein
MKACYCFMLMLLASVLGATTADARPNRAEQSAHDGWWTSAMQPVEATTSRASRPSRLGRTSEGTSERASSRPTGEASGNVGPRPAQWCGWWMRTQRGGGAEYNLAWNWTKYGSAGSPQVGAIVVWAHHVGMITGRTSNGQWIVKSGNDSGSVRERPRSIAGAVVRV